MIFSYECWKCNEHPLFMSRDDLSYRKSLLIMQNTQPWKSWTTGILSWIDTKDFLEDDPACFFRISHLFDRLKLDVDSRTVAKQSTLKEIIHLERDLAKITRIEKDLLKLLSANPQNGQTHSNNSSAICRQIVWVCLMFDHFAKLALKRLRGAGISTCVIRLRFI